jgi:hypothetical protein
MVTESLVAVAAQVIGALSRVAARRVLQIGRPPRAGFVAYIRPLNLEDIRTQVAKELGAGWASQNAAKVQNTDALEGTSSVGHERFSSIATDTKSLKS